VSSPPCKPRVKLGHDDGQTTPVRTTCAQCNRPLRMRPQRAQLAGPDCRRKLIGRQAAQATIFRPPLSVATARLFGVKLDRPAPPMPCSHARRELRYRGRRVRDAVEPAAASARARHSAGGREFCLDPSLSAARGPSCLVSSRLSLSMMGRIVRRQRACRQSC
jgi:hypothetical protein